MSGSIERLKVHADTICRRAEIMRQYADQLGQNPDDPDDNSYRPVADADADREELLAADLRVLLSRIASLEGENERLEKLMIQWRIAAQRWTPGGSEFMEPRSCEAYIAERRQDHAQAKIEVARQTKRAEAAEMALKPFAEAVDSLDDDHRDDDHIWESSAAMCLTAGDLREARSLLPNVKPDSEPTNTTEETR